MRQKTEEELRALRSIHHAGQTYYFSPSYPAIAVSLSLEFVREKTRRFTGERYIASIRPSKHEIFYLNNQGQPTHARRSKIIADTLFVATEGEQIQPVDWYYSTRSIAKNPSTISHSFCGADLRFLYRYKLNDDPTPLTCRELAFKILGDFDIRGVDYRRLRQKLQKQRYLIKQYHSATPDDRQHLKPPPAYIVINNSRVHFYSQLIPSKP